MNSLFLALSLWGGYTLAALDPKCAPGGNFDLKPWNLQLPVGDPGKPTTIKSADLQGCNGFDNPDFFFTNPDDGALVLKVPGSPDSAQCVTTPNSKHCRTELREVNPSNGQPASWDPKAATNRLFGRLLATSTGDKSGTVVGQIHIDDSVSTKPVAELYYAANGDLSMGVEQTRDGGNQIVKKVGNVPVGTEFTYEIRYEGGKLSVLINGGSEQVLDTYQLDSPASYFKAGNYLQGTTASNIHFFEITVKH
ncbi:polysaccharide lyase family 7 protein [Chaetomium sp. MPI-SDFR-AT-0129]|nr:polysaccharide lyase family 7 protein [Chaetomium sp. MPI-SDFR-AT-0129]